MHRLYPLLVTALCAAHLPAQQPDPSALLSRYPTLQKVTVQRLLRDAKDLDLELTPAERRALKAALYRRREAKDGGFATNLRLDMPPARLSTVAGVDGPGSDIEYNDEIGYAEDVGGAASIIGENAQSGDLDTFRWTLAAASFVTATVQATGATPISDSTLELLAADGGRVAFNDDGPGLGFMSQVSLYLPAGTYHWQVGSFAGAFGGEYDVVVQTTPAQVTACGATAANGRTGTDAWTVTVAASGELDVQVTATQPGADLALAVLRLDGTLVFGNDDAGGTNDPRAKIGLPAGVYHLEVVDLAGGAEDYAIQCAETPGLTDLCTAGLATGSLLGAEEADLFQLDLTSDQAVDLITADDPASMAHLADSIVALYDASFRRVLENDDFDSDPNNFYSRVAGSLPTATYYVQVRGFSSSSGDYQISATCGQPFATAGALEPGVNLVQVNAGGAFDLYSYAQCTDSCQRLEVSGEYFAVLDAAGNAVASADFYGDALARNLAGGSYFVVLFDRFRSPSVPTLTFDTEVRCDAAGDLVGVAKDGSLTVLAAEVRLGTPRPVLPSVTGLLCLDIPVTVGLLFAGADGRIVWQSPCPTSILPGVPIYLQQAEFAGPNTTFPMGIIAHIGGVYMIP